ncbi:MAG: hypothetical protein R3195_15550 [Gemmatimonadota bacterium]|nr:hypothetical protein [Gemmatimonadota bacterium]
MDRCTWGVAPFRTSGAHDQVVGLGSGVPNLLNTLLNGSISSPGLLAASSDSPDEAVTEALGRHNERMITGSVPGGPERVQVQAESRGTRSGRILSTSAVEGPVDSLSALAGRLALELSVPEMDAAARGYLAETPPAAVAAALEGMTTLCADNGTGNWRDGAQRFMDALAIDSTFALAAVHLGRASFFFPQRDNIPYDYDRVYRLQWEFRDRLPGAERVRLELLRDPDLRWVPIAIERYQDAVDRFPESYWLIERLHFHLFNWGQYAGVEDWSQRTLEAMRTLARLQDHERGVHCQEAWVLNRLPDVPAERWEDYRHCTTDLGMAIWRGDASEESRLRQSGVRSGVGAFGLRYFAVQNGWNLVEWEPELGAQREAAGSLSEQLAWARERMAYERISGRPAAAAALIDSVAASLRSVDYTSLGVPHTPWALLAKAMESAVFEPGPAPYVPTLESRMYSFADTAVYDPAYGWNSTFDRLCPTELARVSQRDTSRTRASVQVLRAWQEGATDDELRFCADVISALHERVRLGDRYAGTPAPELARLDSIFALGPMGDSNHTSTPLILARLHWERADTAKAFEWVRRRVFNRHVTFNMPPWLRAEGRISVAVGDFDRARRAYRHFLLLRPDPEPGPLTAQRDSVIAELACIDDQFVDMRDPVVCGPLLGVP